jgi:mono/diheme cytochrome c family protein
MLIKKIYLAVTILAFAFLFFQCSQNSKNKDVQGQDSQVENTQTENNQNDPGSILKGNPVQGKEYFMQTCSACHGQDAKGLPKLGKDLTTSKFVHDKSDKDLVKFIEQGRLPTDPLNTTGVAMPPKGGNPALTDQQIMDIVSYVRTIHK